MTGRGNVTEPTREMAAMTQIWGDVDEITLARGTDHEVVVEGMDWRGSGR